MVCLDLSAPKHFVIAKSLPLVYRAGIMRDAVSCYSTSECLTCQFHHRFKETFGTSKF